MKLIKWSDPFPFSIYNLPHIICHL